MNTPTYHRILPIGEFLTYPIRPSVDIIQTHQTHSNKIIEYKGKDISSEEVDGIMSSYHDIFGLALAIKTADCMPIVLLGKTHVVFLHAGWRGLANGILQHTLIHTIKPFYAFIGPSIQQQSFEVENDFRDYFDETNFYERSGKLYFDLQKEASDQIYQSYNGVKVVNCGVDTMLGKKFHSYREDKTQLRNWNLFSL